MLCYKQGSYDLSGQYELAYAVSSYSDPEIYDHIQDRTYREP